jgi:hypothetical protein
VRDTAHRILARAEFQPPHRSLLERGLDWIGRQLGRLFGQLSAGTGGSQALTWLVLLAAAGTLAWFVARSIRDRRPRAPKPEQPRADVEVATTRTAAEWRSEAARLEAGGDWKEGLRCRYRALVADLVHDGVVADVAGRTTGELRADVATARPTVSPAFAGATELFERAWYGDRATGASEAQRFQSLEADVLAGVGG